MRPADAIETPAGAPRASRWSAQWSWETLAFAAFLFVVANPVAHVVRGAHDIPYTAFHPLNLWAFGTTGAALLPWLLWLRRAPASGLAAWRAGAGHLLLAGCVATGALWSVHFARSLVTSLQLLAATALALFMRHQLEAERQWLGALAATGALVLVSLLMIAAWPVYGLSGNPVYYGAWTGAFADKNNLALIAALLVISAAGLAGRIPAWVLAAAAAATRTPSARRSSTASPASWRSAASYARRGGT